MDAIGFMKQTLDFIHRGFNGAPEGLSDEQLHFVPEGQSHSVAWCMWHAARIEDLFFQQIFQGKPSEWEAGGWASKTGLPRRVSGRANPPRKRLLFASRRSTVPRIPGARRRAFGCIP